MISAERVGELSGRARKKLDLGLLVNIGDTDWVRQFRDNITEALIEECKVGGWHVRPSIRSPKYDKYEDSKRWQEFVNPGLELLKAELKASGYEVSIYTGAGASVVAFKPRHEVYDASSTLWVDWRRAR